MSFSYSTATFQESIVRVWEEMLMPTLTSCLPVAGVVSDAGSVEALRLVASTGSATGLAAETAS